MYIRTYTHIYICITVAAVSAVTPSMMGVACGAAATAGKKSQKSGLQ